MNIKQKIANWFFKNVDLRPRSLTTMGNTVYTDTICEKTVDVGVDIDGLLVKDGTAGVEPRIAALRSLARIQLKNTVQMTNDPEMLDGTKVEYVAGNIMTDKNKLEIKGGSATAADWSWMYWDIPASKKVYVRVRMKQVDCWWNMIQLCNETGATKENPPNIYGLHIFAEAVNEDFRLYKQIDGVWTFLQVEGVEIPFGTWVDAEIYFEGDGVGNNRIMCWRDNILKMDFSETETSIPNIKSVRLVVNDNNTAAVEKGHFGKPFIILYE